MTKSLKRNWENRISISAGAAFVIALNVVSNTAVLISLTSIAFLLLTYKVVKRKAVIRNVIPLLLMAFIISLIQTMTIGSEVIYKIKFFGMYLCFYHEGVIKGIQIFLRVSGSLSAILIVMASMKITEFLQVIKWIGLPDAFIEVIVFAIKFIYIFKDEISNIRKAQKARLGYKDFYTSIHSISNIAGIVLIRAFDRSKTLAVAMKCRGFEGKIVFDPEDQ